MTLDQFFEKLPRDGWRLDLDEGPAYIVREGAELTCPICYIAGRQGWSAVHEAADAIGLNYIDRVEIIRAADGRKNCDPALRARLLEHCGLTEGANP